MERYCSIYSTKLVFKHTQHVYMYINEKQSRKKTQLYSVSYGTKIKKNKK